MGWSVGTRLSGSSDAHLHRVGRHGEMDTIGFLRPDGLHNVEMTMGKTVSPKVLDARQSSLPPC